MLHTVINALLPVVLTLLLGYIAGWHRDADAHVAAVLNTITLTYALPLALFTGAVGTTRVTLLAYGPLALTLLIGLMVPYAVVFCIARFALRRELSESAMWALMMGSPSTAFTGLPVLTAVVGAQAAIAVSARGHRLESDQLAGHAGASLNARRTVATANGHAPAAAHEHLLPIIGKSLAQPIVIAPLFGFVLVLCDIRVPNLITHATSLLGVSAAGISLFASGIILQAQKPKLTWPVGVLSIVRTAAWFPASPYWRSYNFTSIRISAAKRFLRSACPPVRSRSCSPFATAPQNRKTLRFFSLATSPRCSRWGYLSHSALDVCRGDLKASSQEPSANCLSLTPLQFVPRISVIALMTGRKRSLVKSGCAPEKTRVLQQSAQLSPKRLPPRRLSKFFSSFTHLSSWIGE